jgi:lysozyme family protein
MIMADFKEAYDITLGNEGGYDNDPDDVGGETYRGIARKYWSNWEGWQIVDEAKHEPNFPKNLANNEELNEVLVPAHYKENFWDKFDGDEIPVQFLANELFDTGVNMGVSRAVKFLQTALNVLNRNGKLYPDIEEDGAFGKNTLHALNSYLSTDAASLLFKIMNILQGMHYIEYMKKDPVQEKYARGWFNRVDFIKG